MVKHPLFFLILHVALAASVCIANVLPTYLTSVAIKDRGENQHSDIEQNGKPISDICSIECVMSKADLHQRLNRVYEITLSVKGRKSGRDIPRPVWFVHEGNTLYLLPVQGSDTNWYKNLLVDSTLKISVNGGEEIPVRGKPITDSNRVDDIVRRFKSKYGEGDVKKYYPKVDVAVQIPL